MTSLKSTLAWDAPAAATAAPKRQSARIQWLDEALCAAAGLLLPTQSRFLGLG
jgi:hypothetical protein